VIERETKEIEMRFESGYFLNRWGVRGCVEER